MTDPEQNVVDMVTEVLQKYQNQETHENVPVFCGFMAADGGVYFAYTECGYTQLRSIASAINDEATLQMIAVNQDRLQKLIDEANPDEESE